MSASAKNTVCLWYNDGAEDAARFYAAIFPDSTVGKVFRAPSDYPSGKAGDVLTVEFTVFGIPCLGLNGGSAFVQSEAFISGGDQRSSRNRSLLERNSRKRRCGKCVWMVQK